MDVHTAAALMGVPRHPRPASCSCDGYHTDVIHPSISVATHRVLIDMETCAFERAVLVSLLINRGAR